MKFESGGRAFSLCFMTPTWEADLAHFRWLRRSLEVAGLAEVPHIVVVQTEDRPRFEPFAQHGVQLVTTAEVLPGDLEARRLEARDRTRRYGRRLTRFATSLNKRTGWYDWVRYAGWQTQQITKLQVAGAFPYDITVVFDSDVVVTRRFDLRRFAPQGQVAAFEQLYLTPQTRGLAWRWYLSACALLRQTPSTTGPVNGYVGTPFPLDRQTVTALHSWLERQYGRPWYETLLAQPVSGWSEFTTYNLFARARQDGLRWVANASGAGLDNAADAARAEAIIRAAFTDPAICFLGIPSKRFARGRWSIGQFDGLLASLLDARARG